SFLQYLLHTGPVNISFLTGIILPKNIAKYITGNQKCSSDSQRSHLSSQFSLSSSPLPSPNLTLPPPTSTSTLPLPAMPAHPTPPPAPALSPPLPFLPHFIPSPFPQATRDP